MARRKLRVVGILVLLFVVVPVLFVGLVLSPPKNRMDAINREDGDRMVNALEAYHRANGVYPDDLAKLAPKFIPNVLQQHRGSGLSAFGYKLEGDKAAAYTLEYDEAPLGPFPSDGYYRYDSKTAAWTHGVF